MSPSTSTGIVSATVTNRQWLGGLLLTLAVAMGVRFIGLGGEEFWLDEWHSMANSAAWRAELESIPHGIVVRDGRPRAHAPSEVGLSSVWHGMVEDTHPPLYFVVLNIWRRGVGDSELAVRLLSTCCSLMALLCAALLFTVTRSFGQSLAVAFVTAFCYGDIVFAQQARPYTLALWAICGASTLLFWMHADGSSSNRARRWVGGIFYSIFLLMALLTHYFAVLPLAAHGVFASLRFRGRALVVWLCATGAAALFWVVLWGPSFLEQWQTIMHQPWLIEKHPDRLWRTLLRVTDLPMRLLFAHDPFSFSVTRSIAGAGIVLVAVWLLKSRNGGCRSDGLALFFLLSYAIPVGVLLLIDLVGSRQMLAQTQLRYAYIALPGFIGLLVLASARVSRQRRWIALATFAVGVALTLRLPARNTPDARAAAALIASEYRPGDILIYDAVTWPSHWALRQYTIIHHYLPDSEVPFVLLDDSPTQELLSELRSFDRFIVVCSRPNAIPNPLPDAYELAKPKSGYIDEIGWVFVFERRETGDL